MRDLPPSDVITRVHRCRVCGSDQLAFAPVLGDALAAGWELAPDERAYIDLQQGLHCRGCGANLRVQTLAAALLALHQDGGTFVELCRNNADFRQRRVLEINSAGTLTGALKNLPCHRLASYPEVDLQRLPYEDGAWDVVIHSDTLEHIPDPAAALRECRRVLSPGGWLAFTIPIVHARLTRSTAGRPPTWHGSPDTTADDWRVCTEYGADFYRALFEAGFAAVQLHSLVFPASMAVVAVAPSVARVDGGGSGFQFPPSGWGQPALERLHRYGVALEWAAGLVVLECGCGAGDGSRLLATRAAQVIGVDSESENVAHARAKHHAPNLEFRAGSLDSLALGEATVDLAVCFETLEHVEDPEPLLAQLKRVLRPGGRLLVSVAVPQENEAGGEGSVGRLKPDAVVTLLRACFAHVAVAGQRPVMGSAMTPDGPDIAASFGVHAGDHAALAYNQSLDGATTLLVAGSDVALPALPLGIFAGPGDFAADLLTVMQGETDKILADCPLAAGSGLHQSLSRLVADAAKAEQEKQSAEAKTGPQIDKLKARLADRDAELRRIKKSLIYKMVRPLGRLFSGW